MKIKWVMQLVLSRSMLSRHCMTETEDVDRALRWGLDEVNRINLDLGKGRKVTVAILMGQSDDEEWRKKHGDFVFIGRYKPLMTKKSVQKVTPEVFWRPHGTAEGTIED